MKRLASIVALCIALVVVSLSLRSRGQLASEGSAPPAEAPQPVVIAGMLPPPQTRVESVAARKNAVIIRGYSEPVTLNGDDGSMLRLSAIEVKDLRAPLRETGLLVTLRGAGRNDQETQGYIDRDEIDGVIEALDVIGRLGPSDAAMPNIEGSFRTRGDVEIANVDVNGSRMLAIRGTQIIAPAGQLNVANALFRLSRLDELHRMLSSARDALDGVKEVTE